MLQLLFENQHHRGKLLPRIKSCPGSCGPWAGRYNETLRTHQAQYIRPGGGQHCKRAEESLQPDSDGLFSTSSQNPATRSKPAHLFFLYVCSFALHQLGFVFGCFLLIRAYITSCRYGCLMMLRVSHTHDIIGNFLTS